MFANAVGAQGGGQWSAGGSKIVAPPNTKPSFCATTRARYLVSKPASTSTDAYDPTLSHPQSAHATHHHPPIAGTDATDHDTMHPGVWLAFGDLKGQDFWRNQGRIEHVRFTEPPQAEKERLRFATECRLLAADGATLGSLSNR